MFRLLKKICCFSQNRIILPRQHQVYSDETHKIRTAITSSIECDKLAQLLRNNMNHFYDLLLAQLFHQLNCYRIQLDHTFDSIIAPISIEFIKQFTRNNGFALGTIVISAAELPIKNAAFWDELLHKLEENNNYRYLTLKQNVELLEAMVKNQIHLQHTIIIKLMQVVHQQKKYYSHFPQLLTKIQFILSNLHKLQTNKPLKLEQTYKMIV